MDRSADDEETVYELVSYFDPMKIQHVPFAPRVFLMGQLGDLPIVEFPATWKHEQVEALAAHLKQSISVEVLLVPAGVRFMKLTKLDTARAARLQQEMGEQAVLGADAEHSRN